MNIQAARLRLKTRFFTLLVVLSSLCGNFSLRWGMRQVGSLISFSPLAYMRAVFNPWVALGISLLIVWVASALAGRLFLHEEITRWRWAGILSIVAGVALVARTAPASPRSVIMSRGAPS